jgi:hypothetical protein
MLYKQETALRNLPNVVLKREEGGRGFREYNRGMNLLKIHLLHIKNFHMK